MADKNILIEIGEDRVAALTLNRPERLNALDRPLAQALARGLADLDADPGVGVVILKGAGKAFCAGIDINEMSDKTAQDYRQWVECMEAPLVYISRMKKPVIAQVQGVAVANGMGLVAAADLAVAAETARMGLTAINVGLNCIGPVIPVSKIVGRKKALELLFFGELIKAPEALSLGLVNKVVAPDDLEADTRSWAALLAQKSPLALEIAKQGFYAAGDLKYDQAFGLMNEMFARLCTTHDAHEGVKAFLEKRRPVWQHK